MLTHEISHNFKFFLTKERNQFVFKRKHKFISRCCDRDSREKFKEQYPDFVEKWHLDNFSSFIHSLLITETSLSSEIFGKYAVTSHPRDIIKKSFMELLVLSGLYLKREQAGLKEEYYDILKEVLNEKSNEGVVEIERLGYVLAIQKLKKQR